MSKAKRLACGSSEAMADPSFEDMRAAMDKLEQEIAEQGLTGRVDTFFGFRWGPEGGKLLVKAMWMERPEVEE